MKDTFYKVFIDEVEVAIFNSDSSRYLVQFLDSIIKEYFFDFRIEVGYYNDANEWVFLKDIDEFDV